MIEELLHDAVAVGGGSAQMLGDAIAIVFAHAQDGRRGRGGLVRDVGHAAQEKGEPAFPVA